MQILIGAALAFAFLLLASAPEDLRAQQLYKHVGPDGKVTYTDRPQQGDEKPADIHPPNVATPEERQQMYEEACRDRQQERYGQARGRRARGREDAAVANCVNRKTGAAPTGR